MIKFVKVPSIIRKVKKEKLSYLTTEDLYELYRQVKSTRNLKGNIIETGCALGGSSIVIAKAKSEKKKLYVYDVFDMIPPPTDEDGVDVQKRYGTIKSGNSKGIGGNEYYGYRKNLLDVVKGNYEKCGVSINENIVFIKGLYQETLLINEPVSFAHIDCDWYDSVMVCLRQILPNLVVRGKVIIDDYNAWSGCKKAVDEYFSNNETKDKYKLKLKSKMLIERVKN